MLRSFRRNGGKHFGTSSSWQRHDHARRQSSNTALRAAAQGDLVPLTAGGEQALVELVMLTHSGLSVDAFEAEGPRFGMIVHHTDAAREWTYDRESHIGRLARGLDEAPAKDWLVVDRANNWRIVWPEK
jgi:hypothetical protein